MFGLLTNNEKGFLSTGFYQRRIFDQGGARETKEAYNMQVIPGKMLIVIFHTKCTVQKMFAISSMHTFSVWLYINK